MSRHCCGSRLHQPRHMLVGQLLLIRRCVSLQRELLHKRLQCLLHCLAAVPSQPVLPRTPRNNGMCDNSTGLCTCVDNDVGGHWTDTSTHCTTCRTFYYWHSVHTEMPVHGARWDATKDTAECQCFDSDALGHFSGKACEKCKTGYVGQNCKSKDVVVVTRQRPCSSITTVKENSAFALVDPDYNVILTGGRPVIICNVSTKSLINTYELAGTVIGGAIINSSHIVLTVARIDGADNVYAQRRIYVRRGESPELDTYVTSSPIYYPSMNSTRSTRRRLPAISHTVRNSGNRRHPPTLVGRADHSHEQRDRHPHHRSRQRRGARLQRKLHASLFCSLHRQPAGTPQASAPGRLLWGNMATDWRVGATLQHDYRKRFDGIVPPCDHVPDLHMPVRRKDRLRWYDGHACGPHSERRRHYEIPLHRVGNGPSGVQRHSQRLRGDSHHQHHSHDGRPIGRRGLCGYEREIGVGPRSIHHLQIWT